MHQIYTFTDFHIFARSFHIDEKVINLCIFPKEYITFLIILTTTFFFPKESCLPKSIARCVHCGVANSDQMSQVFWEEMFLRVSSIHYSTIFSFIFQVASVIYRFVYRKKKFAQVSDSVCKKYGSQTTSSHVFPIICSHFAANSISNI